MLRIRINSKNSFDLRKINHLFHPEILHQLSTVFSISQLKFVVNSEFVFFFFYFEKLHIDLSHMIVMKKDSNSIVMRRCQVRQADSCQNMKPFVHLRQVHLRT